MQAIWEVISVCLATVSLWKCKLYENHLCDYHFLLYQRKGSLCMGVYGLVEPNIFLQVFS